MLALYGSPLRRGLCTMSFRQQLQRRMREVIAKPQQPLPPPSDTGTTRFQELQAIDSRAAGVSDAAPAGLASLTPKTVDQFRRKPREGPQRRMVDHRLPPYVECNFRSLHFMMVRYPKVSDFPRERWAPAPAAFLIHALSDAANPACPRPLPSRRYI